jgi:hypothetical protein
MLIIAMSVIAAIPSIGLAADCKTPSYAYLTMYYTGTNHYAKVSKCTGITVHSGKTVMNNEVTPKVRANIKDRVLNTGSWKTSTGTMKNDVSTSGSATINATPITQYVDGAEGRCIVKCFYCNSSKESKTGEKTVNNNGVEIKYSMN